MNKSKELSQDQFFSFKSLISSSLKALLNAENKRIALNSIAATTTISILFLTSLVLYLIFYFFTMPTVKQSINFYFDYSARPFPQALIDFKQISSFDESVVWKSGQKYNLGLELVVPDSNMNFNQGNFMITIHLLGSKNNTLTTISKPAHLTYKSPLLRTLSTILFSPLFLSGSSRESSTITLSLIENYLEKGSNGIHYAKITLGNPMIQTYSTSMLIDTHFQGLAYFMHHWWLSTALFFMSNFMLVEVLMVSFVWSIVTAEDEDQGIHAAEGDPLVAKPFAGAVAGSVDHQSQEVEKIYASSSNEHDNDNETLDGESITEDHASEEHMHIEPQGLLRGTCPISRGALSNRQQLSQSGNFSYPYARTHSDRVPDDVVQLSRPISPSRSHSTIPSSVSGYSSSISNTSLPDTRNGSVVPDLANDRLQGEEVTITEAVPELSELTASSIHQFGEDSTIHQFEEEVEEEFDLRGLLEKEEEEILL